MIYSFARYTGKDRVVVVSNFSKDKTTEFYLKLPKEILALWKMADGTYPIKDALYGGSTELVIKNGAGEMKVVCRPSESFIYQF